MSETPTEAPPNTGLEAAGSSSAESSQQESANAEIESMKLLKEHLLEQLDLKQLKSDTKLFLDYNTQFGKPHDSWRFWRLSVGDPGTSPVEPNQWAVSVGLSPDTHGDVYPQLRCSLRPSNASDGTVSQRLAYSDFQRQIDAVKQVPPRFVFSTEVDRVYERLGYYGGQPKWQAQSLDDALSQASSACHTIVFDQAAKDRLSFETDSTMKWHAENLR